MSNAPAVRTPAVRTPAVRRTDDEEPPDDLIGTAEAGRLLKIRGPVVVAWIRRGVLPGWTITGARFFVSLADVKALLKRVAVRPKAPPIMASPRARACRDRHTQEVLRSFRLA